METTLKTNAETTSAPKVGLLTKAAYGGGNLAANLLVTTASSFISYFYTEVAGIAIGIVGVILLVCRLLDGVSDLTMGAIVDKTHTKTGKARPWMLRLCIPFFFASVLLWWAPDFGMTGKIIYATVTYILSIAIVYTAISVPYNTLCSLVSEDGNVRTSLSSWRTGLGFAGAMAVNMITLPIVNMFGGGSKGWLALGMIYGLVGSLLYFFVYLRCKETVGIDSSAPASESEAAEKAPAAPLKDCIKSLFKNKYWLMLIACTLITFTVSGLTGANVYYAQYVFGNADLVGLMGMASMGPIAAGVLFVTPLVKRFGKKNVCMFGMILSLVGIAITMLFSENWNLFFLGLIIKGCGISPTAVTSFAMLADAVDYGEWKFGVRADGLAYSASGFGEKVGSALGGLIVTSLMALGGYVANQAVQSPEVITSLKVIVIYVPLVTSLIAFAILCFYDLEKKMPQIHKELAERKAAVH